MESPLGMQFNEFDADKDGRITDTETYELLKLLGKNTYTGAVKQVSVYKCRRFGSSTTITPPWKLSTLINSKNISIHLKHNPSKNCGRWNTSALDRSKS